jgi:hypothetical protein
MPYLVLLALGAGLAAVVVRRRGHFDTHLPPAFEAAVVGALRSEKNPGRLRGFGEALLPDYPIAGCVLLTRARNIMTTGAAVVVPRWNWALRVRRPGDADAAQTVVGALASDPRLLCLRPDQIARRLGTRVDPVVGVLNAAQSAGRGIVVDPKTLRDLVGIPTAPASVEQEHVRLILESQKRPAARRVLNHLRVQNPQARTALDAASRTVTQALWAKRYSSDQKGSS